MDERWAWPLVVYTTKIIVNENTHYPLGSPYPSHPVLKPRYVPQIIIKTMEQTFVVVTMAWAKELCKYKYIRDY